MFSVLGPHIVMKDKIYKDDNLSLPLEIEGGHWDGTFRRFLWVTSFFIVILVVIAFLAPVREVAQAEGEIIPLGSVVQVEHLEGGIVAEVFVKGGATVREGDVIMRLRAESGSGDFNEIRVRRDLRELRRLRYVALLKGGDPDFGELGERLPEDAADQKLLFDSEKAAVEASERVLEARLKQRESEQRARRSELDTVETQIEIFRERLASQRKLLQKGFSSRANLLQVKARLEEVKGEYAQLNGALEASRAAILELNSEAVQAKNAKRQEWSDLLLATLGEIAELDERLTVSRDRVNRLVIKAPRDGRVQSLAAKRPGEVIRPGDVVAEIVPLDAQVEAEVRILPKDIGHVSVGFPAEVTLSTFDPEIFGKLYGEVRDISPTTFETEQGEKYYRGYVKLDRHELMHKERAFPITAGMIVTASVTTGSKSVMHYLLKPVFRSYDRAFSER